jgi:hypothetical protein
MSMQNKQPRAHHDIIIAWANGEQIQYRKDAGMAWTDCADPAFVADYEYRVKPAREYPQSDMSNGQLHAAFMEGTGHACPSWNSAGCRAVANAALKDAIDQGQVVTREEFDRAIGDRKKRDFAVAEAVRDKAYVAVMNCDNNLEGVVVRSLDVAAIISEVKNVG